MSILKITLAPTVLPPSRIAKTLTDPHRDGLASARPGTLMVSLGMTSMPSGTTGLGSTIDFVVANDTSHYGASARDEQA